MRFSARGAGGYVCLAFVAMAGLAYVNFLPSVVGALSVGIGLGDVDAGRIVAANGYGGILGTSAAVALVRRVAWRPVLAGLLVLLAALDASSAWIHGEGMLHAWRFGAGVVGGLCLGIGLAVLARLHDPDRAFGVFLLVQFLLGSLVVYLTPAFENRLGVHAIFLVMAGFSLVAAALLVVAPVIESAAGDAVRRGAGGARSPRAVALLGALLAYQLAASALWAYVGRIGAEAGRSADEIASSIALTGMLGLAGALLPIVLGRRLGRLLPTLIAAGASALAALMLERAGAIALYAGAMALFFFAWPALQSWLLAVTAEVDASGQLTTIAGVVSSLGLATGPLLAAELIGAGGFSLVLQLCAACFGASALLLYAPVRALDRGAAADSRTGCHETAGSNVEGV